MSEAPIGVFDSGVGGLTVAREIRAQLPGESLLYVGDTEHTPYGPKPIADVRRLTQPDCAILEGAISGRALYDGRLDPAEALALLKMAGR